MRILFCLLLGVVVAGSGCNNGRKGGGQLDGGNNNNSDMGPDPNGGDPTTCADAAALKTYVGCDYWPTVTFNPVWSIFDFAVVVSNPGTEPATITVDGAAHRTATVQPGQLVRIYLPWVTALKGPDQDLLGSTTPPTASVLARGGAYHLVSSVPVLVYQFSALEYQGQGGPTGKSWASCPGLTSGIGCFSFTNDASLLIPSTAMTGNYRVVTNHGITGIPGYFAITATADGTSVRVRASATSSIVAGTGVKAVAAGAETTLTLDAGDVVELIGDANTGADLSGSLVQASGPVQVIGGMSCFANPTNACDHIEETVLPAETWGKRYAVTTPTGPMGTAAPVTVRFVGNVDGTTLTYTPKVTGAPATLDAGDVVELVTVNSDFIVEGDNSFSVSTIQKSASVVDPGMTGMEKGDPSLSAMVAIEQYRNKYVFLAPTDYDANFADVVAPTGASLTLDGAKVTTAGKAISTSGMSTFRISLRAGLNDGAHTLVSDQPFGLQIIGYGSYTSYQYPGGLNLSAISAPPIF